MKNRRSIVLTLATCGLIVLPSLAVLLGSSAVSTAAPPGDDSKVQQVQPKVSSQASLVSFKADDAPLTIGYSDWPGWLVWEIAKQKGFFKDAGVNAELKWFADYGASIDAYTAKKLDGILIDCASSLPARSSVIIVLTDYSNGNDMLIGKKGVKSFKDLKGKTIGLEENLVEHLLLDAALKKNGMAEDDVKIKNVKTEATPATLGSGEVDAIGAWYPISGKVLADVADSQKLFTSADAPGVIFDALQVDPDSLSKRRADWVKVVSVWFKCLDYLNDDKTRDDAVKIMAKRIGPDAKADDLAKNLKGTKLLDGLGNSNALKKSNKLTSVYGSLANANSFYLKRKVYKDSIKTENMVDASLVEDVLKK